MPSPLSCDACFLSCFIEDALGSPHNKEAARLPGRKYNLYRPETTTIKRGAKTTHLSAPSDLQFASRPLLQALVRSRGIQSRDLLLPAHEEVSDSSRWKPFIWNRDESVLKGDPASQVGTPYHRQRHPAQ
jgi:hypothetical protein